MAAGPASLTRIAMLALLLAGGQARAEETMALSKGCEEAGAAAQAVVKAYIDNFNSKDIASFESVMHYPNVRHADGKIFVVEEPSGRQQMFADLEKAIGWDYTTLDSSEIVQCHPDKVHIAVRVTRHSKTAPIHSFDSLYVVTKVDGKWGIAIRSSYAPEALKAPPPAP